MIASLEGNPLALYLSGCGYRKPSRFKQTCCLAPLRALPYFMTPILAIGIFASAFTSGLGLLTLLALPLVLPVWRYAAFERLWRQFARSGKLVDWYLSLKPDEIVLGIAGGRLLGSLRWHARIAFLWIAGLAVIMSYMITEFNTESSTILICAACAIAAFQFIIALDTVYSTLDSIAVSIRRAASPDPFQKFGGRLGNVTVGLGSALWRSGVPAVVSFTAVLCGAYLLDKLFPGIARMVSDELSGMMLMIFYSVSWTAICVLTHAYMMFGSKRIVTAYRRAVENVTQCLPDVIEANPPR
ncbi:MAG: hypothetical protein NTX50_29760 [Candidatus Sumerlaeota bacterium]|nr:hypothetical protein [Candidatus Sumerlaeota bacterium]